MAINPVKETIMMLSEGNPGCMQMLLDVAKVAPNDFYDVVFTLARHKITGSRAYMLWNDACDRDTRATVDLIRSIYMGRLPIETVEAHLAEVRCRPFAPSEYR